MDPRLLRPLTAAALATALLAACGTAGLSLAVPTITIPANSTAGTICYAPGEGTTRLGITSATYDAMATYRSNALVDTSTTVDVRVYGRASDPGTACTAPSGADVPLGGPFTLELGVAQAVTVGEGEAGAELAALVRGGAYWIGVALDAGVSIGGERSITFDQGRVRVRF